MPFKSSAHLYQILPILLFSFATSAVAGDYFFNPLNPDCTLKKFNGKTWVVANPKDLEGKTFPAVTPITPDKKRVGVRSGNSWYGANFFCFNQKTEASLALRLNKENPKENQKIEFFERKKNEEGAPEVFPIKPHFSFEVSGSYVKIGGELSKTRAVPNNGGVGATALDEKASAGADFGVRLMWTMGPEGSFFFRLTQATYKVKTNYSGTTLGTSTSDYANRHASLGYLYSINLVGAVKPYIGAAIGYSVLKNDRSFTGFSGTAPGFDGTLTTEASGLYVSPEIGAEIVLGKVALVPHIRYDYTKTGKEKVNVSSVAAFPEGTDAGASRPYRAVLIGLGLRFIF